MKRLFIVFVTLLFTSLCELSAQSPLTKEWMNAVTELTGSFMDNPYHHSNTVKIFELTQNFKKTTDEVYNEALFSDHPQASIDLPYLNNLKGILKCLDFITASITGYIRGGLDATEWETTFHPILSAFGWTWKVIHSTSDIVFYEYKKDDFRMVLAKNIRPKKDDGDYNATSYTCYTWDPIYKEHTNFIGRIVFGGNFQFVEYGDDTNEYKTITKVTSKRDNKP